MNSEHVAWFESCYFSPLKVVKVHQNTVDVYLEDVIMSAVDATSDMQARQEIQEMAIKINDIAYVMEDK